jgi:acyl-CoA reductase-like NAD-dependent aldehyde dehydrogenase
MQFKTINPATEEEIGIYDTMPKEVVVNAVKNSYFAYGKWKKLGIPQRLEFFKEIAKILRNNKDKYAKLITTEMGKPLRQSLEEVEKCAWTAEVYVDNATKWIEDEPAQAGGKKNFVSFQPLGVILSVMPWNFPFWLAFRSCIPTLIAGNTSILKHSNVVPQCALAVEETFKEAGFPEGVFRTIIVDHESVEDLISFDAIQGVSLTGSTEAGARVAEIAGRNLKKVVLELGGSDPFIVLDDADVDAAAKSGASARAINSGQSCTAAKRFIVTKAIADKFSKKFVESTDALVVGNPMNLNTDIGPLFSKNALNKVKAQVQDAVSKGAKVLCGGSILEKKGYFYTPTVLADVNVYMKIMTEEVFGPVAPIIVVNSEEEAVRVANISDFGLGASIWTGDENKGLRLAKEIEAGAVFINAAVKSDPRMPIGGIKKSGIGRELSKYGLMEFVNIKGVNLHETKKQGR